MTSDEQSNEIHELRERIKQLEQRLTKFEQRERIFEKAFRVMGVHTNYAEFGVYKGHSLVQAFFSAKRVYDELTGGFWNHSFADHEAVIAEVKGNWERMKFFAFDSFKGIPATSGPDKDMEFFKEGTYSCSQAEFMETITRFGIPEHRVPVVPGFFEESCTSEMAHQIGFENIGVVHIDSDLYESARFVLNFITPYLSPNAIIVFDEWYQFLGNPAYGEQRAFSEWRDAHPEWRVTEFQKEGAFRMSFILSKIK